MIQKELKMKNGYKNSTIVCFRSGLENDYFKNQDIQKRWAKYLAVLRQWLQGTLLDLLMVLLFTPKKETTSIPFKIVVLHYLLKHYTFLRQRIKIQKKLL